MFAGVGVGIAVAGVLCLVLMRWRAGSAQAWLALGSAPLVGTAAIWRVFDAVRAARGTARARGGGTALGRRPVRLVVCYGAFGFGYIIPGTFLPTWPGS